MVKTAASKHWEVDKKLSYSIHLQKTPYTFREFFGFSEKKCKLAPPKVQNNLYEKKYATQSYICSFLLCGVAKRLSTNTERII